MEGRNHGGDFSAAEVSSSVELLCPADCMSLLNLASSPAKCLM